MRHHRQRDLNRSYIQGTFSAAESGSYEIALKKVASGALLFFGGAIFARFAGFLRQFIVIRMLPPDQYGLFTLGLSFLNIAASMGCIGLYQGVQRYIAYYDSLYDKPTIKGTIHSTMRFVFFSSSLIFILLAIFSKPISSFLSKPEFRNILIIFCLAIPLNIYYRVFVAFFLGFRRADIGVILNEILFGFLSVLLIYLSLLVKREIYSPIIAIFITYFVLLVASICLYWRIIHPRLLGVKAANISKSLLLFSLPLLFSVLSRNILTNTDTFMLAYYMPSEAVGYYNAAFLLMMLTALFLESLSFIFMPVISGLVARELHKEVRNLYRTVTKWIFLMTFPLILTFFLFPRQILSSLFSLPYGKAGTALAILAAAEFLNTSLGPNDQTLIAYGNTKIIMISYSAAMVFNIAMNAVFIPRMGISGAAAATGLSLIILNLFNSSFLYFKFKIHPFGKNLLLPMILCVVAGGTLYFPIKAIVGISPWFAFLCYPIFLILNGIFTLVTHSISEDDLLIYRAIKARLGRMKP